MVSLDLQDRKTLLALCRAGRLYEIEDWIKAGKPLVVDPSVRKTPLEVSIDTGFHSMIVLLVRNEPCREVKNRALARAVEKRKPELAKLLVDHGADTSIVPFIDVLRTWDADLTRFFLQRSTDFLNEQPFAVAFSERVRSALRAFKECVEAHPEAADKLKAQSEMAPRHFTRQGNLKWVSLMLWIGADPRAGGPEIDSRYGDDPECHSSAMEEACFQGSIEVLRRFKPSGELDDLSLLLKEAAHFGHADVVRYLLSLGAEPNNKSNGGSTALDCCLWHLEFEDTDHIRFKKPITRYGARRTWETLQVLLGAGARWRPDDRSSVNQLRRTLLGCEPTLVIDILNLLKSSGAAGQDAIRDVVSTPSMQKHLADKNWHLRRLGVVEKPSSKPSYISYRLLSRFNREQLFEEVWSEPTWNLAPKYGVSDVALAKTCRKLKVPLPGRGYWAKVAAGKVPRKRPPLPVFPPPSAQNRKAGH
jgi:hypothetical protein